MDHPGGSPPGGRGGIIGGGGGGFDALLIGVSEMTGGTVSRFGIVNGLRRWIWFLENRFLAIDVAVRIMANIARSTMAYAPIVKTEYGFSPGFSPCPPSVPPPPSPGVTASKVFCSEVLLSNPFSSTPFRLKVK